ncbi:carboxy methyl transferase for protein phosphatase 2A [Ceratobasidium sp. UAMH 11750]|nr:carboxy methyl transferase for protein phosphatase 2A [Ceratobasidium sp. UAMH 11750]
MISSRLFLERGGTALRSQQYHLLPLDLRAGTSALSPLATPSTDASSPPPLNPDLPTLFIAECVFVYMLPSASAAVVQWFAETFSRVAGIVYEMFGLQDSFGKVLKENLKARHIDLPGADAFPTLDSQMARFSSNGLLNSKSRTLKDIRRENIPDSELQRISRLEHLDEIEELELVLAHYAITWGHSDNATIPPNEANPCKLTLETWGLPTRDVSEKDTL